MSERTEQASPNKRRDERKKGNVAKSREATNAITFCGVVLGIMLFSDFIVNSIKNFIVTLLDVNLISNMNISTIEYLSMKSATSFLTIYLPIGLIILVLGVIGNVAQSGFLFTTEPLKPKLSKLNPINGLKNMFSMKALGTLIKSVAIVCVLGYIGTSYVISNIYSIMNTGAIHIPYLLPTIIELIQSLFLKILIAVIVIGVIDYAYQKYTHNKQLKMTKQEVKEEYKQMEGDPQVKGKIKQKQKQMATSRMMQAVPSATVILTNPTHISIALRYEEGKDSAPVVVAKGADHVAFKIREIAKEHDIPIIENKPLTRALFKQVELEEEIPVDFYQIVSEILVAVYRMKNRKAYKRI